MCFACTRIWCVRPVFSRHCIRDAVPAAKDSKTCHVLTACRPLHQAHTLMHGHDRLSVYNSLKRPSTNRGLVDPPKRIPQLPW